MSIYYEIKDFENAIRYYELSINSCTDDSVKYEIIFQKIKCDILQSKFQYALINLYEINATVPFYIDKRRNFYLGICFFGLENFELSEKYFIKSLDSCCIEQKNVIHKLFKNK